MKTGGWPTIVQKCQQTLPQQELFAYLLDGDGQEHDVTSTDVNDYLRRISGSDFTAKDFSHLGRDGPGGEGGLREMKSFDSKAAAKRNVKAARSSKSPRSSATR